MTGFLTISSTSRLRFAADVCAEMLYLQTHSAKSVAGEWPAFPVRVGSLKQLQKERSKMTKLEKILYTARVHTTGGRDGRARTDDGRLQVALSTPGTSAAGTNPEQLFAAGWSACFLSAVKIVAAQKKIALPDDVTVDAEIDLGLVHGSYNLAARINVNLPGMDDEMARGLVEAASHTCPYSLATSGNIEVHHNAITAKAGSRAMEAEPAYTPTEQ